jgi:DNA-binding transcriptional MerR regulator
MSTEKYRIGELAEKAGVTKRTIHYYIGRGLLPPPEGAGLGTLYSDEHLFRIRLIKKLQDEYLPLDEIRRRVGTMEFGEVKESLVGEAMPVVVKEQEEFYPVAVKEQQASCSAWKRTGAVYERIDVGFGVEIHFPAGNEKAGEIAEKLYKYADKLLKEG